ncbi:MAG: UvrD-helicase domain-containing protein, partial [Pirellulaceae bacterium]|nr:UvrD-helicase domain-containing protein [Pirellulaceae bacterium]
QQARQLTITTFHSFCARILRHYADHLNLPVSYSIYDTSDQTRALKQALQELEMSATNFRPSTVLSTISNAKNELADPEAYGASATDYYSRQVAKIYRKYQQILHHNHALDFDDLLLTTVRLVRDHKDVLAALRDRFQYVLIDEYQDTNHAQFVLAHALAAVHRNLCVTGDPDQSIYSWRGADIRNILEFERHYPDAKVVRLEQNYRSTKRILAAADKMIRNNVQRKHKALWTQNELGQPIRMITCGDEQDEARTVVESFDHLHEQSKLPWSSFAVFYRTNSLSRVMEEAFLQAGVPYQIARGTAFYDRKEIKDAVAYLRVINNPADEVNLLRIINTPARGISAKTVKALQAHAISHQTSLASVLSHAANVASLSSRAVKAITTFDGFLRTWRSLVNYRIESPSSPTKEVPDSLRDFVERVLIESGLESYYRRDGNDPEHERLANLVELIIAAQIFESENERDALASQTWAK